MTHSKPTYVVEADKWVSLAAKRSAGGSNQRTYSDTRDQIEKLMARTELLEAQQRMSQWLESFARRE